MSGRLAQQEAETYQAAWSLTGYGDFSPGERYAPLFLDMVRASGLAPTFRRSTVLDAGTGSGKGALALSAAGFEVSCCDCTADGLVPAAQTLPFDEVCLWGDVLRDVGRRDWVVCADVLEHIPTPFTMLTVYQLLRVARYGLFLTIALVPDHFGVWLGKPLHQTVQPFETWKLQLSELGTVTEARDCLTTGIYMVQPT